MFQKKQLLIFCPRHSFCITLGILKYYTKYYLITEIFSVPFNSALKANTSLTLP